MPTATPIANLDRLRTARPMTRPLTGRLGSLVRSPLGRWLAHALAPALPAPAPPCGYWQQ
jgi:hypothetical protein